ncbi:Transposase [Cordylochernes scorpioides]|uniref:Transposase n=1 Tax=Cordylochernes scorpioides TaxID=51811 RepID=A0ABY6KY46_9ARAC|nr:Transposase [Cordylochernes scorpioides]
MLEFETGRAIGLKEAGWSNRLIARHLCRSDAVIRRCWQKWVNNGSMQRQDGSGRPRATTEREDRAMARMAVAALESTLSTIQRVTGTQVSKMTINRRLRERNLRARRPLRCLPLTPVHLQVRLQWCRERSTWNCANWGRIVFSDESCFLLCPDDRRKRVWRRPGQRVDPGLTVEHHTGPQQGVMVWGAISFDSRTPLVVIPGTLTAQRRLQPSQNVDYLARQLETIWQEIPQHTIRNIYQSMTRRVAACIQAIHVVLAMIIMIAPAWTDRGQRSAWAETTERHVTFFFGQRSRHAKTILQAASCRRNDVEENPTSRVTWTERRRRKSHEQSFVDGKGRIGVSLKQRLEDGKRHLDNQRVVTIRQPTRDNWTSRQEKVKPATVLPLQRRNDVEENPTSRVTWTERRRRKSHEQSFVDGKGRIGVSLKQRLEDGKRHLDNQRVVTIRQPTRDNWTSRQEKVKPATVLPLQRVREYKSAVSPGLLFFLRRDSTELRELYANRTPRGVCQREQTYRWIE